MIDKHLWLGLYQIARHLLHSTPDLHTLEGQERADITDLRGCLVQFIGVTERYYQLDRTFPSRVERKAKQYADIK